MMELFPDILRGSVTSAMFVLLLFTLAQPRYGKKSIYLAMAFIFIADILISLYFYRLGDLTALARFGAVYYLLIGIAAKPLCRDRLMQWCFNFFTAMNVFVIVMILSFLCGQYLPYPEYANTFLRFILFSAVILLYRSYLRPLYRQTAEHWNVFSYVALAVLLNFLYHILTNGDIKVTMRTQAVPLLLLVLIAVTVYLCIFISLQGIASEYALREQNIETRSREDLLRLSANAMQQQLQIMDSAAQKNSMAAHDRRHLNNVLLELLRQGNIAEAATMLETTTTILDIPERNWCENPAVNAVVNYYTGLARKADIELTIQMDVPTRLTIDSTELCLVIANLLENAIHACQKQPEGQHRYLRLQAQYTGQILLEIENSCFGKVLMDTQGFPVSLEPGHGIGTRSVLAFAQKHNATVFYKAEEGFFRVRILI